MTKKNTKNRSTSPGWYNKSSMWLLVFLIAFDIVLAGLNVAKAEGMLIPEQEKPLIVDGVVELGHFTLDQKIAQMIIVLGVGHNSEPFKKMQLGGIHLHAASSETQFKDVIEKFQKDMVIPFFVTVDLEGCVSPFASFLNFTYNAEINGLGAAFAKGKNEGKFLHDLGVSINFAPVVDLEDSIWKCRTFPGDEKQITELANSYLLGLQDENIIGTAKHYPGKTLIIKDPHKYLAAAEIEANDLYPYQELAQKGSVKAVMVSHLITYGEVNSEGKPSDASQKIISGLRDEFNGIIVTDEINMLGLKKFYKSLDEMYLDVFNAGPDVILNFNDDPNEIYHMIQVIKEAVERGKISEERIDDSVEKILVAKGFKVER